MTLYNIFFYALIYALVYLCTCVKERKASLKFLHKFYTEVMNINFWQILHFDVKGTGWLGLELSIIVGRFDMWVTPYTEGLYPSTFADFRFSWRIESISISHNPTCVSTLAPCSWGFIWGAVNPPFWGSRAMSLEALAIPPIPGFQIVFPGIIWWPNIFLL